MYAVVGRFIQEGRAAFNDRKGRGPKPLLEESANEYIERLLEEGLPTEHGWLRSRWSCKLLALELFKERATLPSRESLRPEPHVKQFLPFRKGSQKADCCPLGSWWTPLTSAESCSLMPAALNHSSCFIAPQIFFRLKPAY